MSLSRQTIGRRIADMASDIEEQLKSLCDNVAFFSIALDESSDAVDTAQLLVFVWSVDKHFSVIEEMLDIIPLHDTTKGIDIFNAIDKCFGNKHLEWGKTCEHRDRRRPINDRQ